MNKLPFNIIPFLILSLVIFFMIMDFIFIGIASKTYSGLFTENYFQKGIEQNKTKNQQVYKKSTNWNATITFDKHHNYLAFKLSDHNKQPISNAIVNAKLIRPVTAKFDFIINLKESKQPGSYESQITFPLPGQWDIRVKANFNNHEFIMTKRVLID